VAKKRPAPAPKPSGPPDHLVKAIGWRLCRFANGRDGCRCSEKERPLCASVETEAHMIAQLAFLEAHNT